MNLLSHCESVILPLVLLAAVPAMGAGTEPDSTQAGVDPQDVAARSLEQLTQVEITSAGRKDQKLSQVPAAVFVITAEDIRHSGVSSVPELLRMVPGIQVAQIAANIWAISSRGFNGRGANRMLVMIDGRSIYNSLFSGTFWDQNQVPLDEIERIEVIRGAGATMWGANAVDGVISIVTKKAKDTRGTLVTAEAGQTSLPDGDIQFGDSAGNHVQYRVEAGFGEHPGLTAQTGGTAWDRWNSGQGDVRVDWQATNHDALDITGGIYDGGGHETFNPGFPVTSLPAAVTALDFSGGYLTGRWQHQFTGSDIALEVYYDRENRSELTANGDLNTLDFDFQHHIRLGRRNDVIWGAGYRRRADNSVGITAHDDFEENLFSLFAQDEISLVPEKLSLTAGARVQDYRTTVGNNTDFQPQIRLLWAPSKQRSFWGAVSRAVHSPSQLERDMLFSFTPPPVSGLPATGAIVGNPDAASEVVVAYEAGYRQQIGRKLTFDLALFFDHRTGAFVLAALPPYLTFNPAPTVVLDAQWTNGMKGDTRGAELAWTWALSRRWHVRSAYSREDANLKALPGETVSEPPVWYWRTPRNTLDLGSGWDINRRWSVDATFSWVSRIPDYAVPHYTRVDLRVARKLGEGGEISAGVRNLFDREHLEFISEDYIVSSLVRRDAYAKLIWRF